MMYPPPFELRNHCWFAQVSPFCSLVSISVDIIHYLSEQRHKRHPFHLEFPGYVFNRRGTPPFRIAFINLFWWGGVSHICGYSNCSHSLVSSIETRNTVSLFKCIIDIKICWISCHVICFDSYLLIFSLLEENFFFSFIVFLIKKVLRNTRTIKQCSGSPILTQQIILKNAFTNI